MGILSNLGVLGTPQPHSVWSPPPHQVVPEGGELVGAITPRNMSTPIIIRDHHVASAWSEGGACGCGGWFCGVQSSRLRLNHLDYEENENGFRFMSVRLCTRVVEGSHAGRKPPGIKEINTGAQIYRCVAGWGPRADPESHPLLVSASHVLISSVKEWWARK